MTALALEEAVELGYALIARVAETAGVRALGVKGPILAIQGLREPTQSVDVDVLVDPNQFDAMRSALEAVAWHDGGFHDTALIVPLHSVMHRHPLWPIEVDVHCWFPGLLGDPADVFEVLWDRRTTVRIAHASVPAPDRVAHAALAALHYLRDAATEWGQASADRLARRVETWSRDDLVALGKLAAATGATESLEPFLRRVGAPIVKSSMPLAVSLDDWNMRADAETRQVLPWLVELRRRPWRRRPAYLWWSLWLTDEFFRSKSEEPMTGRDLLRARLLRLHRAWRALPAARADLARLSSRKGPSE
jgi:hypothetical protein